MNWIQFYNFESCKTDCRIEAIPSLDYPKTIVLIIMTTPFQFQRFRPRILILGLVPLALFLLLALPTHAQPLSFIAIGDMPYSEAEAVALEAEIPEAIQGANPPFVVHYGDLKGGGETCSQALLQQRRDNLYGLLPGRVFYNPGDNEWTDCDRSYLDPPISELGQLDAVRRTLFPTPLTIDESWAYVTQANFPENARWIYDDVVFATVHLVSGNNGREEVLEDDLELALALVDARDQANRVWLEAAFAQALDVGAKAVVIVTQADTTAGGSGACTAYNRVHCDGFANFRAQLGRLAGNFRDRGQPRRPVLLVHGDTNPYCWDKDFGGVMAPNLWRLNGWGDFQSPPDATQITVDPANTAQPFQAQTLIHQQVPTEGCNG
jgi:hypothetical protein